MSRITILLIIWLNILSFNSFGQTASAKNVDYYWSKAVSLGHLPDSSEFYAREGLELATSLKDKRGIADMHYLIAFFRSMSNTKSNVAMQNAKEALSVYKEIKVESKVAKCLFLIGRLEYLGGNYPPAVEQIIKALDIHEKLKDYYDIINAKVILAQVYGSQNELSKNLKVNNELYHLTDSLLNKVKATPGGDRDRAVANHLRACINLGNYYQYTKKYERAIWYYSTGLKLSKGNPGDESIAIGGLSICFEKIKNSEKAIVYAKKAMELAEETKQPRIQAIALQMMATLTKNYKSSEQKINQSITLASAQNERPLMAILYGSKSDLAANQGDYKAAYESKIAETKIKDSLFNIDKAKQIAKLESVNQLAKTRNQLRNLELKNYRNSLFRNSAIVVSLIFLIALTTLAFYFSKLRKLNLKLAKQSQELQVSNDTKDKIFSVIGHDLRGPISSVSTISYLLKNKKTPAEQKEQYIEMLEDANADSLEILNKLTAWGETEFNKKTALESVDIQEGVVETMHQLDRTARKKGISIQFDTEQKLRVNFNPYHFNFIVRNLLQNAIKFSPSGSKINVNCREDSNQNSIVVAISDQGIGMTEDVQDHLLSNIVESKKGTADEKGLGIGLMLCNSFARLNGGRISFSSVSGSGTTFMLAIPCT